MKHIAAMRMLIPIAALLLAACSKPEASPDLVDGTHHGPGRNRLCVERDTHGQRAGLIVYGQGNLNCSASGRIEGHGETLALVLSGDAECRIGLRMSEGLLQVRPLPKACAYYCAPGVTLSGAVFVEKESPDTAVDGAGDPLC